MSQPTLSLDDLCTAWLKRHPTRLAAMPGLNNAIGSIQAEADPVAFKHPVFPPYSGGNEVTAYTVLGDRHLAQLTRDVEVRWRAYRLDRRCEADGWRLTSRTCVVPDQPVVVVELTVANATGTKRRLDLRLLLSGRARNTGNEGYAWAVPSIATDVSSFVQTHGLEQTVAPSTATPGRRFTNDEANAHSVQAVLPEPDAWEGDRAPRWRREVSPGGSERFTIVCSYHADAAEAERLTARWLAEPGEAFEAAEQAWTGLWNDAFTPGNATFSGHLPVLDSPHRGIARLYYNAVLTLLTCRRDYPHATVRPCYLTLWPRRGEGSAYLAWELPYTSGILARLDPAALVQLLEQIATAPLLDYQMSNYFTGGNGGWACCSHPMALQIAAWNLARWSGDTSFLQREILRQPKSTAGFEAGSQGQVTAADAAPPRRMTLHEAVREAALIHRDRHLPGRDLVDYGHRGAYLECITTYAHGTAGHTAVQAHGLRTVGPMLGLDAAAEADRLERATLKLYRDGRGYFACAYPDGRQVDAANLYDLGLVLRMLGARVPAAMRNEITTFVREQLITPTWAHCLRPTDPDIASGVRCDHQWAGCFPAWPSQFIQGALAAGDTGEWLLEWMEGMAAVVDQGPFAQAYWAEDLYPPEAGGAAKCFDELTQGNHWVIGSGVHFAEAILDGVCGLSAPLLGTLQQADAAPPWGSQITLHGIMHQQQTYTLDASGLS